MDNLYCPEGINIARSENREYLSSLEGLEYAMNNGIILEARAVMCDANHNLQVDLGGIKGIIPKEEAVYSPTGEQVKDIAVITRVGKPVCFMVTDINCYGINKTAVLSRRLAQKKCFENKIKHLKSGDIINSTVTHMEPFGAFCDIGCGIIALMPIDCISVSRISHPKDRFFAGQRIKCVIKSFDRETLRVTLTHKELLGTWEENASLINPGETVTGIVRSVEPYGVFVELSPNLAGLAEWCDGVYPGQQAAVYIKSIIPEKMKIKLVIVDVSDESFLPPSMEYFVGEGHIDSWEYSPKGCVKQISSVFE